MKKAIFPLLISILFFGCEKAKETAGPNSAADSDGLVAGKAGIIATQQVPGGTGDDCTVTGNYSGTFTSDINGTAPHAYKFLENNYAEGSVNITSAPLTFGGYRTTCDSIFMTLYNVNLPIPTYYIMKGKTTNGFQTITGVYINKNNAVDKGTFNLSKL